MPPKRDDEKTWLLIVAGIFTIALFFVDFKFLYFVPMWHEEKVWVIVAALLHLGWAYSAYSMLKYFDDPNKDYYRWLCILCAVFAALIIGIFGSDWVSRVSEGIAPKYGV